MKESNKSAKEPIKESNKSSFVPHDFEPADKVRKTYLPEKFVPEDFQEEQKPNLLQQTGNFTEENFNKPFEQNVVAPAMGFAQGIANIPSGAANLARSGLNMLPGVNIPKVPAFDVAPHTMPAQLGELGSFFTGGSALSRLPQEFSHLSNAIGSIPMIGNAIKQIGNTFSKNPTAASAAGNALLGGVYTPDHPVLGMAAGGAIPMLGKAKDIGLPLFKNAFNKINPNQVAKTVQGEHDILDKYSSDLFNKVGREVEKRQIGSFPIDTKLIDKMRRYLPKTDASEKLIQDAKKGDYQALRDAQSDLFHRGTKFKNSDLQSEVNKGEEAFELRDKINHSISNHLEKTGHKDLADLLNEARGSYHKLKEIYYSHPTIGRMVHKESRKIPKNIGDTFAEESVPMERLRNASPNILRDMENLANKENSLKKLKYLGTGTAGTIGLGLAAPSLYHKFSGVFNE